MSASVGWGAKLFPFDLRLIVTTSKEGALDTLIKNNTFHVGLYQKMTVEVLELKPLRERTEDLKSHLIPHFVERACRKKGIATLTLAPEATAWFLAQTWIGNLGELEKKTEQLVNLQNTTAAGTPMVLPTGW